MQLHVELEQSSWLAAQTRFGAALSKAGRCKSTVGEVGEDLAQVAPGFKRGWKGGETKERRFGVAEDAGGVNLHGLLMQETYVIRATRVWALIRQVTKLLLLSCAAPFGIQVSSRGKMACGV